MYVRSVVEADVLAGLAVPPGPELSAALDALDLAQVPGDQVVEVLRAQARQCAHEQARLWATLVEVGLADPVDDPAGPTSCDDPTLRPGRVADRAPGEIAAALTWTHRTADWEFGLAEVVVRGLPDVFAALSAGRIDRGKAVVFAQHLDPGHGLTPAQTQAILARLLPVAPRLTTSQLRGRLWRALLAIDPGWARRRYTRAVRARAVTAVLADDGTVTVTGSGLPADEAAVACARVDRLAESAKRAGHPGRVGQIAADVFLGLLDGRFHGRSEDQIVAALLRESRPEDRPDDTRTDDPATDEPCSDEPGSNGAQPDEAGSDEPARVGIEVRVGLTTMLGFDERPGEIPGLGPILAPVARAIVNRQLRGAEWRFAVTDDEGHLLLAGVTRHRPSGLLAFAQSVGRCRGGIVELQVSAAQLDRLAEGSAPGWAGVVTDIAARYVGRHAVFAGLDERPDDRFPAAALARHIQVRDRTCSHPGCRRPARRCDLDHTRDHARPSNGPARWGRSTGPAASRSPHHCPSPYLVRTNHLSQADAGTRARFCGGPTRRHKRRPDPRPPTCTNHHPSRVSMPGPTEQSTYPSRSPARSARLGRPSASQPRAA